MFQFSFGEDYRIVNLSLNRLSTELKRSKNSISTLSFECLNYGCLFDVALNLRLAVI
jgi:hypothetical protein